MKSIAPYPIAALCALAMIVALFLSWFVVPSEISTFLRGIGLVGVVTADGMAVGPINIVDIPGFNAEAVLKDPLGIAIAGSIVLAAAVAILGFLGGIVPRLFAILAGAAPFGILAYAYFQLKDQLPAGFALPSFEDVGGVNGAYDAALNLTPFLGVGFYAYFGGALLLLLLGLFSPAKSSGFDY